MDTNQVTEQTSATPETPAVTEAPAGRVSVGDSVRAAMEKYEAKSTSTESPFKPDAPKLADENRERAPDGKFAKKTETQTTQQPAAATTEAAPVETPKQAWKPPQSVKNELKAKWEALPPEWQEEVNRLERDAKKQIQGDGELKNFAKSMQTEMQPYEHVMRQLGVTPQAAVRGLMKADYDLRTGTPQQKQALLFQIAQNYGVDLNGLYQSISQGQVPQVDPNIAALQREVQRMQQERNQEVTQRQQNEQSQIIGTIEQFAADPKHEHFEQVRLHMGALMDSGAAQTLEDAYDQACYANPEIRAQLIGARTSETQRVQDERKAVEAKKAAAVSVKGSAGAPTTAPTNRKETVRQTIERMTQQAGGRI